MNRRHTFLGFALTLSLLCSLGLWWQTQFTTARAAHASAANANFATKSSASELASPLVFATFTVTNTGDNGGVNPAANAGTGTLRQAIVDANANLGADTIVFNLGTGTPSIALLSSLPTITDPVTISGNTGGATRVELNGAGAGGSANGLRITAGSSTIEGMVINRFGQSGILLQTSGGNIVRNCYIGTNASGTAVLANLYGVQIDSAPNNTIGGTTADERNLISGNGSVGMWVLGAAATGNKVSGNYIGTDVNGTAALGNRFGVQIRSSNTTLGGTTVGERNVISGNTNVGVYLVSAPTPASGIKVSGNYIGVDVTGTTALGNAAGGIRIEATSNNTIGGTSAAERNVIAGNSGNGVLIIGTTATGNDLRGNAIFNNTSLGIDLGENGVAANDALDADTGPNKLQNFPVLDPLTTPGTVTGTLDSATGNSAYPVRLEFFANTAVDASGNGEGEVFLGATTLSAPGAFSFNYAPVPGKPVITSTATDANGNTSEFSTSACSTLSVLTVNNLGDLPDANTDDGVCADSAGNCSLRAALMQANAIPACVPATINFSVTGVINLTSALPNIAVNLTINGPGANLLTVRRDTGGDYGIFVSNKVGKDLVIQGLTVSNGKTFIGGGIVFFGTAASGSLTLTNCVISGNEASQGGGIFVDGKATISGCTISGNTATYSGGINYQGFSSPNRTMRIINSTISGNSVGTGGNGAGIVNAAFSGNNRLEVINSTIVNNTDPSAIPFGGVVSFAQQIGSPPTATTVLRNSIIANNTEPNVGIDNSGGSPGIMSSLGNNLTSDNGGGFLTGPGDLINTNPLLAPLGNYGGPTLTHALLPGSPAINAGNNCVLTNTCTNNNLGFNLTNDQRGVLRPQTATVDIGAVESQGFTLAVMGGNNQSTPANSPFPAALQVNLKEGAFNLPGALITFTGPGSGPSINPVSGTATTDANGNASRSVTANTIVGGPYAVAATTGALSQQFSLTNLCPITTFTPSLLPNGQAGVAYSQILTVTPAGSYTFSLLQGNLPSGLTLNPVTGVISGLPVVTGTYNFLIRAQVAGGCSGTQAYSLTIICPTVTVFPASLPNGITGTPYSQAISASPAGGNYSFILMGTLPPGLNLNSSTGVLSGTPTAKGTFNFSVTATGFGSCASAPKPYTIIIGTGGCSVTLPASLPGGPVGQLYMQTVAASPADNYTYTQTGTLPPGVSFYDAAALLFGYPTTGGSYTFTITATLGNCSATQNYTVVIGTSALRSNAAVANDFDGDGKSDMAVWRGTTSEWLIRRSSDDQLQTVKWGASYNPYRDVTVAADYDGDGKTDIAVFRRENGHWYIRQSSDGKTLDIPWGIGLDVPVPADYDGDGKADIAVWRGSEGNWYIRRSSDDQVDIINWGSSATPYNDVAVPGDYDGDGKTDIAVFRQSNGHWFIKRSSDGVVVNKYWGMGTDVPVPADYDGDGKTDIAVWRGSDTNWYVVRSSNGETQVTAWGGSSYGDKPTPGDYDGDGKADLAVWRASDGSWHAKLSHDNSALIKIHGQMGDSPTLAKPRQ